MMCNVHIAHCARRCLGRKEANKEGVVQLYLTPVPAGVYQVLYVRVIQYLYSTFRHCSLYIVIKFVVRQVPSAHDHLIGIFELGWI